MGIERSTLSNRVNPDAGIIDSGPCLRGFPFLMEMAESEHKDLSLASFATDQAIIRIIAKERVKNVKRMDRWKEGECPNEPVPDPMLLSITPPSQLWRKYGHNGNGDRNAKYHALTKGLTRLMEHDVAKADAPKYAVSLKQFIETVQSAARTGEFAFEKPVVLAKFKKKDDSGKKKIYRPICSYTDLTAKVVIAILADYLATTFDKYFHEEMLAFRKPRTYHGCPGVITSNHDALKRILEYRAAHDDQQIWVAECDIQKFFDIIDHQVVLECFDRLAGIAAKDNPGLDMSTARTLLQSFMDSYSFPANVKALNNDTTFWQKLLGDNWNEGTEYKFEWIEEWMVNEPENATSIGIPQGASISAVITNMVLSSVDEPIVSKPDSERLFVRYCDDIVIMHTSQAECMALTDQYRQSLETHHLLYHPFKNIDTFAERKCYWDCKSKNPFLWGEGQDPKSAAKWIGFLGFEISHKGDVRVRKSTIAKKSDKLYRAAKLVLNAPNPDSHDRRLELLRNTNVGIPGYKYYPNNILYSHTGITPNPYTNHQVRMLRRTLLDYIRECVDDK